MERAKKKSCLVARQRYSQRDISSSSLTVCSGTVPPQKNLSSAYGQAVYTNPYDQIERRFSGI